MRSSIIIIAMLGMLGASCSSNDGLEHVAELKASEIVGTPVTSRNIMFAVQRSQYGGATGETLYKVWSCTQGRRDCRLQATVDTNDMTPPKVSIVSGAVTIVADDGDTIWNFCNRAPSRQGPSLKVGLVYR